MNVNPLNRPTAATGSLATVGAVGTVSRPAGRWKKVPVDAVRFTRTTANRRSAGLSNSTKRSNGCCPAPAAAGSSTGSMLTPVKSAVAIDTNESTSRRLQPMIRSDWTAFTRFSP